MNVFREIYVRNTLRSDAAFVESQRRTNVTGAGNSFAELQSVTLARIGTKVLDGIELWFDVCEGWRVR